MKFCKDCRHIIEAEPHSGDARLKFASCAVYVTRPEQIDPVLGVQAPAKYGYCSISREHGPCGAEAKFFAPKLEEVNAS